MISGFTFRHRLIFFDAFATNSARTTSRSTAGRSRYAVQKSSVGSVTALPRFRFMSLQSHFDEFDDFGAIVVVQSVP